MSRKVSIYDIDLIPLFNLHLKTGLELPKIQPMH